MKPRFRTSRPLFLRPFLCALALLLACPSSQASEIVWKTRKRSNLLIRCDPEGKKPKFRSMEEIDDELAGNDAGRRQSFSIAELEPGKAGGLVLLFSQREEGGDTYLVRRERKGGLLLGVFPQTPVAYDEQGLQWRMRIPATEMELSASVRAGMDNGMMVLQPGRTVFAKGKGDTAGEGYWRSSTLELIKDDSLRATRLVCAHREYFPDRGYCREVSNVLEPRDVVLKPMIYLYPDSVRSFSVTLDPAIPLVSSYPKVRDFRWQVEAFPDGRLVDRRDGKEFYGLFWEAGHWSPPRLDSGFVVKGEEFAERFDSLLVLKGLNYRERQEFVTFWMNRLQPYPWVLIRFFDEAFAASHGIGIVPAPPAFLRVFAVFTGLQEHSTLPEQRIVPAIRHPHSAVEWGGEFLAR